jgi:hypothetical protein
MLRQYSEFGSKPEAKDRNRKSLLGIYYVMLLDRFGKMRTVAAGKKRGSSLRRDAFKRIRPKFTNSLLKGTGNNLG